MKFRAVFLAALLLALPSLARAQEFQEAMSFPRRLLVLTGGNYSTITLGTTPIPTRKNRPSWL